MVNYSILEENIIKYMNHKYKIHMTLEHLELRLIDLGLDSLDMVELIITLEEKYGIIITPSEFDETDTFRKLVDILYNKIKNIKKSKKS